MPNPYLDAQRRKYESLRESIHGLQQRAVDESRDLTNDEMRSVEQQGEQAKTLATEIENLAEIEKRSQAVENLAAELNTGNQEQRSLGYEQRTSSTHTQDRDPGHYRKGGNNSFFGDLYRARSFGDPNASSRLQEHHRALSTSDEGAGVTPPRWLTDEFMVITQQGRNLANAVRNIPLGSDPRPLTLPKQTGQAQVGVQASENTEVRNSEPGWDSGVTTVAPKTLAGQQVVSRQLVDASTPEIDQLIYGDLMSDYNAKLESMVGSAIIAEANSPITATAAQFHDMSTNGTNGADLAVRAAMAVRQARHRPADILAMSLGRYGEYLQLKDSTGRPLIPDETAGPRNVAGVGEVNVDGTIKQLGVVATEGMEDGVANQDTFAAVRSSDTILFESDVLRFRYEEQKGPESIILGVWGYVATIVRMGDATVQCVQIDTT